MQEPKQSKGFWVLLLRGALGGLVGSSIFGAVEVCLLHPVGWGNWLGFFLLLVFVGTPFSLFLGLTLSVAIWFFHRETEINLGLVARSLIGTCAGIAAVTMWWFISSDHWKMAIPRSMDFLGAVLLGAAFGGIPALVIGSQRP